MQPAKPGQIFGYVGTVVFNPCNLSTEALYPYQAPYLPRLEDDMHAVSLRSHRARS